MSSPESRTTFRDQISDNLPYSSWNEVEVLVVLPSASGSPPRARPG